MAVHPGAEYGGRLLTLAGDRNQSALLEAVTSLVLPEAPDHPRRYGDVLEWVVISIADLIVEKMDSGNDDTGDISITIQTPDGTFTPIDELPAPLCHVWEAVTVRLGGELIEVSERLFPVVHVTGAAQQALALLDAVGWLDRLLAMPSPETAYEVPG
ncbi:hypothetical protein ACFYVR_06970 [Rhodococcus sp. NPDC003318]|uniref:hypothetical protein n=1 Tax=Rhodococcus sp. NPDC003318 TaxID=3364503 RepID=UPI00368C20CC